MPLPNGGAELVLQDLVPGEQITISYLYFPPVTWQLINSYAKFDDGMATYISVLLTRQYPKWLTRVARVVFYVGLVAIVYLTIELIRYAAARVR